MQIGVLSRFCSRVRLTVVVPFLIAIGAGLVVPQEARAEAGASVSQEEANRQVLRRIDELEAELKALKGQVARAATASAEAPVTYPTLRIGGFSDVTFSGSRRGSTSGASLGQYALQLNSSLSPRWNFFGEFTAGARADAGTGAPPATGFNAEIERAILRFDQSDAFKLSFGRYHTPINWWNNAFHHGLWLQSTVGRPEMTQFGGRFIPVHFIGTLAEGEFPAKGLNLNYGIGLGNGRGAVTSRGGDAGDINNSKAYLVNLFVKPDKLYGLRLGGSYYRDRINMATGRRFDETIVAGHLLWDRETPELIAEYARAHHKELIGGNFAGEAYYVQLAYRLPGNQRKFKPYVRFENMRLSTADPVYTGTPGTKGVVSGIRYDLSELVALKAEYRNLQRVGAAPFNGVALQLSFSH